MENKNGNKTRKNGLETRVKTEFLKELHLSKLISSVSTVNRNYKRGSGYIEETEYFFEASITTSASPYSGIVAHSNSEQDAINKLNDLVFMKAKDIDALLYRQTEEKIANKKNKKKSAHNAEAVESDVKEETSKDEQTVA